MREAQRRYTFSGLCIASSVRLQGLLPARCEDPIISIVNVESGAANPAWPEMALVHTWKKNEDDDEPSYQLYAGETCYRLVMADGAAFVVDRRLTHVTAVADSSVSEETLSHLLLDQVLPRILAHMGKTVLHAGAVAADAQAICFIGETGAGKSTLTASFHLAGFRLLSDDAIVVDIPGGGPARVTATYPSIRLWPSSVANLYAKPPDLAPMAHYSDKHRLVLAPDAGTNAAPPELNAIFVLAPPRGGNVAGIDIRRMAPSEAFAAVARNCFQLDPTDRKCNLVQFSSAVELVKRTPVFSISYPRDFASLGAVRGAILAAAELKLPRSRQVSQMEDTPS